MSIAALLVWLTVIYVGFLHQPDKYGESHEGATERAAVTKFSLATGVGESPLISSGMSSKVNHSQQVFHSTWIQSHSENGVVSIDSVLSHINDRNE